MFARCPRAFRIHEPVRALCILLTASLAPTHARAVEPPRTATATTVPAAITDPYHPPVTAKPGRHGPFRTDPSEGIPRHAYSPFDDLDKPKPYQARPQDCLPDRILLKVKTEFALGDPDRQSALEARLAQFGIGRLEPAFRNPVRTVARQAVTVDERLPQLERWFKAALKPGTSPLGVAKQLADYPDPDLAVAEPDFIRKPLGDLPGSGTDDYYDDQWHLPSARIPEAWAWLDSQGLPAGGSRDIVIAVIDTGVDIEHPDLAANIWTNSREIAGDGIDNDGNGFIDDVHGCNVVSDSSNHSGNPMDDHGHGTHVAGIIAAQGMNTIGVVGVAYNAQLMPIKAAQYSGVLATSDIAEAINYAVAQGADIINMSFGGYARSQIEEDALAVAFGQCVLVAAPGNDGVPNEPCDSVIKPKPMYPAAYNWVLGVMARTQNPDAKGNYLAGFSNFDGAPNTTIEYELMAPGADIWSTLPGGQYAAWDGTSMATPVVSGLAALARTRWTDKDTYSSRFIMGQIATTGPSLQARTDNEGKPVAFYHVADAYAALTTVPKPQLSYLQHWLFDTTQQGANDDDDGILDAGETVDLAIIIRNQWGKADPVTATLEAWASGATQADPYVTWLTNTVDYGAIGSFNWDDNGLIYDAEQTITGVRYPFRFTVSPDCPNDRVIPFRLTMSCRNGLDPLDTTVYTTESRFQLLVQRGRELPHVISQDMTLTKENLWLVPDQTLIESGATLTVTEGTQVQFWSADPSSAYGLRAEPLLQVEGHLVVQGTPTDPAELFNGSAYPGFGVLIRTAGYGTAELRYAHVRNPLLGSGGILTHIDHCRLEQELKTMYTRNDQGQQYPIGPAVAARLVSSSAFRRLGVFGQNLPVTNSLYDASLVQLQDVRLAQDDVFLKNYRDGAVAKARNTGYFFSATNSARALLPEVWNGKTYLAVDGRTGPEGAEAFAVQLGGHLVAINDAAENEFLTPYVNQLYFRVGPAYPTADPNYFYGSPILGLRRNGLQGDFRWITDEPVTFTNWCTGFPSSIRHSGDVSELFYGIQPPYDGTPAGQWRELRYEPTYPRNPYLLEVPGALTQADLDAARAEFVSNDFLRQVPYTTFQNNAILNVWWDPDPTHWLRFRVDGTPFARDGRFQIANNYWGTTSPTLIRAAIWDHEDDFNLGRCLWEPVLSEQPTNCYPFVAGITLSSGTGINLTMVGAEAVTFTVSFNRDMETNTPPQVSFGPDTPLTDYTIHPVGGGWQDPRTWVGTFNITPITGDGYQLIRVAGAVAADDPWLVTGDDAGRFRFEIITSGTESMNLQATGAEGRVNLSWMQDDFDLLAGYHLYRSTSADGAFTRINPTIIPPQQKVLADTNVAPGQPYYYKFTVVKSDMSESDFSNLAQGTPLDTIPPAITHTPLTSATPGLPLTLFADVTDNVGVQSVTLQFRTLGGSAYTARTMTRPGGTGDRYAATIEGSRLVSPGIEYYVEATDGISTVSSGRAELPWQVVVDDRPVITAVTPGRGPASGGTPVTIAGSNFKAGAHVTLGGVPAADVVVVSANQITCTTPPHFPATVDVVVSDTGGQSGTLLRAFTYESDKASLGLPPTGGGRQSIVQVPLNAAAVNGLASASFTVTFDPAVLVGRTARTGSLTPGWSVAANTNTAGQLRVSMASSGGTVSGSGVLAQLEFEVVGNPGATTPLTLSQVSLNDGAMTFASADGSFAVSLVYDVSGRVTFWKNSASISNVQFQLAGERLYAGVSVVDGSYTVAGAEAGAYTLTPSKSDQANGITAYDASLALQHDAQLITLSGPAATAADVNGSGQVTAMDAFYMLQRSVGLIELPFQGVGRVWAFSPSERVYPSLTSHQTGQDFVGILLGDPSGNWSGVETGPLGGISRSSIGRMDGESSVLAALVPPAAGTTSSNRVRLLLKADAGTVYSVDARLTFEPVTVQVASVTAGTLSGGMLLASNTNAAGEVRCGLAAGTPVGGVGTLVDVVFDGAPTAVAIASLVVNEGGVMSETTTDLARLGWYPVIQDYGMGGTSRFTLRWASLVGNRYQVQYKERLTDASWQNLGEPVAASGAESTYTEPAGLSAKERYYRVLMVE